MRETLADLAEILPRYRDLSIPDPITSTVKQSLAALDRAIQVKDGNQFATHQSYDRAVPTKSGSQLTRWWSKGDSNSPSHPERQRSDGRHMGPADRPGFGVAPS
jgi:hypothetical protein